MNLDNESVKTIYVVAWGAGPAYNRKEFDTMEQAEVQRWKMLHEQGYRASEVRIHIKQLNKFGDVVVI